MTTDDGPAAVDSAPLDGAPEVGRHRLGPHVVGQRIVVRRIVRGETGPSGGPALTDVLGVCESWTGGVVTVRRADDSVVRVATYDIVSGKPVPPRPSLLMRVSPDDVERRAADQLRPREREPLGDWLLRCTGGTTGRTNSVLPVGDPGLAFAEAEARVREWYAARDRPAWAQVVVGSEVHHRLDARGWTSARPEEADSAVLLASLPQARRRLRGADRAAGAEVARADTVSRWWLTGNPRAAEHYDALAHQLQTDEVVFASVSESGDLTARGRATYDDGWIGLTDLWVAPARRRTGLARAVVADLLAWGAERGASTVVLQVLSDNEAATALYADLGFRPHHAYRYLAAPAATYGSQTTESAGW